MQFSSYYFQFGTIIRNKFYIVYIIKSCTLTIEIQPKPVSLIELVQLDDNNNQIGNCAIKLSL